MVARGVAQLEQSLLQLLLTVDGFVCNRCSHGCAEL